VPLIALGLILLALLAVVILMPLSLVMRYRSGTTRRPARAWVATLNLATLGFSAGCLLLGSALSSVWVPWAFTYTLAGIAAGCVLGGLGLWLSRWEATSGSLYYTPNTWLVLALTVLIASRVVYGVWRAWHAWHTTPADASWLAASGAAGSLAVGALVVGYYLAYWFGIRRRARSHRAVPTARAARGRSL
jgi:hypothetical protein